jgi:outer membrane protein TolC
MLFAVAPLLAVEQPTDSLQSYLQTAAQNNPGLKSDFLAYRAALQKLPQAGAYSDPQLDMGFYLKPMSILGGREVAQFKLMQMFPWFGTKRAARTEAMHRAQLAFENFRQARDELYLNIYTQWYQLCNLQQQLLNSRANDTLLTQLEALAKRRMAAGGNMSAVLLVQLEQAGITDKVESLHATIEAAKVKFNTLLNRSAESEVILPDSFAQVPFSFDEVSTIKRIETQSPLLKMIDQQQQAYRAQEIANRRRGYPMLGIGLQYMLNKKITNPTFAMGDMNGNDMVMPMFSVTIPLYRHKYKAQQRESRLWQEVSREKYQETHNELVAELYRIRSELENAGRKIALYRQQAQLARTTYDLIVQEYTTGRSELTNVIQVERQLLDYQMKEAEATARYNTMVASIRKLASYEDDTEP